MLRIWFFLEITNFLFICFLTLTLKNKKPIFLYFLIQALSSFLIIFSRISNRLFLSTNISWLYLTLALIIKLRIPPFHFWIPVISKFFSWHRLFILLTIQKIIPFYIISLITIPTFFFYVILILCAIIPPYIILNINNFKILLSYSSINQTRWIIILITLKPIIWLQYFLFYRTILFFIIFFIEYLKIKKNYRNISLQNINIIIILFILNLARMPPFSFFYIKWFRIFYLILNSQIILIIIIIIIRSFIILYIYINIITNLLFMFKTKSKIKYPNYYKYSNNNIFFYIIQLTLSLIILIL